MFSFTHPIAQMVTGEKVAKDLPCEKKGGMKPCQKHGILSFIVVNSLNLDITDYFPQAQGEFTFGQGKHGI